MFRAPRAPPRSPPLRPVQPRHVLSAARSGLAVYRRVLAAPGAAAFCGAGALARLPQAMIGLGSVLMVTGLGRSYALGGFVAGAIALSQSLVAPRVSRLADRFGQARVLLPQLAIHVVALGALVVAAESAGAGALLVALGAAAGGSLPQVGAFARARWTALLTDAARLRTALAVESLIDEAVFVVGPVVVTLLATAVAPSAGLLTAIALVTVGCLLFGGQRRTEPRPEARPSVGGDGRAPRRGAIRHAGLVVIVGTFLAVGAVFGLVEVSVVALAREHGQPGAAGPMLGLWATGSLVAGTAYGAIAWRWAASRRFLVAVAAFAAGTILIAASSATLALATLALFVAGMANAPTLITGNTLVPDVVPASVVTEAYTWLSVTLFAGIAVGSAVAGALVDRAGASGGLLAGTAAAACAALVASLGRRRLSRPAAGLSRRAAAL